MSLAAACVLALGSPAVGDAPGQDWVPPQNSPQVAEFWRISRRRWETGQLVLQGFLGANLFETMERSGGSSPDVDGSGETASQLPVIGGGGQYKLGGQTVDLGIEGMIAFSGRADATAFAVGGGGATVAVKVDMVLFELYGGPFANFFLDDTTRVYVSAGPLMEWADFTQKNDSAGIHGNGTGFGTGLYARTGIEFMTPNRTMIGLGVRWADSRVDLDNDLGSLDLKGVQIVFTVTEGF
jgi:hypothetical protein